MASKVDFDRKDLKAPDPFFETIGRGNRYYAENRTKVLTAVVLAVSAFVAVISFSSYRASKADDDAATFMRATDALDLESYSTAQATLDNLAAKAGGIYAQLASLYRADLAVREGRFDDALPLYDEVVANGRTAYLKQVAMVGKAFALQATDKLAEAANVYAAAAELDGPLRSQALRNQLHSARAAEENDLAAAAIEKILELYPESEDADTLSSELAALSSR